jgi:hypothetical protein
MDDAMVNPRSEMERIPSARMESSARRAPSPVRRPYVARFPPATVAIRNGLRFKSSDSVPNRRVQLGHSPFRTVPFSTAASAFSPDRQSVFGRPLRPSAELLGLLTG